MMKFKDMPYKRPDVKGYIEKVKELTEKFKTTDLEKQIEIIGEVDKLKRQLATQGTLVHIRYTIDTRDEFYKKELEFFDENGPKLQEYISNFQTEVLNSKYKKELEEHFGKHVFNLYEMEKKTFSKEIIEDLVEENKVSNEYQNLIAAAQIDFDGDIYTLSRLAPLMQSTDRDLRKRANEAYFKYFTDHMEEFDDIYDRLVKIRDRMAKKLGFKNYIELGYLQMQRSDYGPEDVKVYREAIKKYVVPFSQEIYKKQIERLGYDELKYYDESLKFKDGNPNPHGEPETLIEYAKEMYSDISPITKEFFEQMTKYELFDLLSRDGKMSGGYCTMLPDYDAQFIFANMNGTAHDVVVLTHEAGHALQGYLSRKQILSEYLFPTLEACEIHSMSMEFFTTPYMDKFFEEDAEKFRYQHLAGTMEFLPYGALIDDFQHYVYENPNATPKERRNKFRELEKIYQPQRDYDGNEFLESGGFFFKQNHVFLRPFYYIDYTLAQICAIGFYKLMKEDYENALNIYLELCKLGGSKSFLELVKSTGLPNPFEESTIKRAVEIVKEGLKETDETKL
ncbi:MAG: M3 family oligoendopeptidase [Tissierellia bacterium]|nr:M3 family oligoendopeptidase [Tissierellia bacterium]